MISWTEEDQIRYETESKERKRKIIQKKLDEAQRRYDEANQKGMIKMKEMVYKNEPLTVVHMRGCETSH